MNEKLSAFFKVIVKYGGANLVILLVSAWFFDSFFHINPLIVGDLLEWLLWIIFFETIYVMIISRIVWTLEKFRDYGEGKSIKEEMNGKAVTAIAKEIGADVIVNVAKKLAPTPEKKIKKELDKIDKEIEAIE